MIKFFGGHLKKIMSIRLEWKAFALFNTVVYFIKNTSHAFIRDPIDFKRAKDFCFYKNKDFKTEKLKRGIDHEGQKLVDKIIKRQEYIYTHNLLNENKFDAEEKKAQKSAGVGKYKKLYSRLSSYPCETFYYHNGLKFLPEGELEKIKGKDVIDAGAFIGDSAVIFSKNYSFGKIYSFEPQVANYKEFKKNIEIYGLKNVKAIKLGLGSRAGAAHIKEKGLGAVLISAGGGDDQKVDVVAIDEFVRNDNLNVGLIKMDIEGAEYDSILGAEETIRKFKPVLLISIYHSAKDFFEIKPLLSELNPEYKFMIRKINPFSLANEVVLIAY